MLWLWRQGPADTASLISVMCVQGHQALARALLNAIQDENSQYKVIEKLRAIGCEFGPCLNAYTGIEETVYEFLVPTDDQEVLPQVLGIVAEFAFKIRSGPHDRQCPDILSQ